MQGLLNSFRWGLDNRIHGSSSRNGGKVRRAGEPDAEAVSLRGRDFAFDPKSLDLRPTSGGGQNGLTFDDWGRKFVSANSDHLQMVMYRQRYVARNPALPAPSPRVSIAADGPQADVYRISRVEPWRIVRTRLRVAGKVPGPVEGGGTPAGYFTAATGVTVYRGDAWPKAHRGRVFIGDVGSNIVHRKRLVPDGVGFVGKRIDEEREFLASSDIWFRPVQMANAPDGTLWVADMYREVVEHPDSLPPAIKKHLDLDSGRDRGRLYRVVPEGFEQPPRPALHEASTDALVETLADPNAWHRTTAARLLYEREDPAAVEPLKRLAKEGDSPLARMHALHALDGLDATTEPVILDALSDGHPRVREHAVRLSEPLIAVSAAVRRRLLSMTDDPDLRVRYQLAFSLGGLDADTRTAPLATLLDRDGDSRWVRLAAMSSLSDGAADVFGRLVGSSAFRKKAHAEAVLRDLAGLIGRQGERGAVASAVRAANRLAEDESSLSTPIRKALREGLKKGGSPLVEMVDASTSAEARKRLLREAKKKATDATRGTEKRAKAVRTLALGRLEQVRPTLEALLAGDGPLPVRAAAVEVLGGFDTPQVADRLLQPWGKAGPALRQRILDALFADADRLSAVLDAVEAGTISAAELGAARRQLLQSHEDPSIRKRAEKLGKLGTGGRKKVVEKYRPALSTAGDAGRGRAKFRALCATCHRIEGHGQQIGPDLEAFVRKRGPEAILVNVLDPNRKVDPRYTNYLVFLDSGRVATGMITAETATSLTLKQAGGAKKTLLRKNVRKIQSTGASLMPEGLEVELDVQGMADLLTYLRKQAK